MAKTATNEVYYKLNENADIIIDNLQKFKLLGKIIGKAVFDRIPIDLAFCRPLLKILLSQKIELEDIKFYDFQVKNQIFFKFKK